MPMLEAALSALDTLSKNDITEVKSMKSPPGAVKLVMEAVCQMLNVKPKRINDPSDPSKKINDYWGPSQVWILGVEVHFISYLILGTSCPSLFTLAFTSCLKTHFLNAVLRLSYPMPTSC